MNNLLFNDGAATPVRIICDSVVMKKMLETVLSGRFCPGDGAAAFTIVCVEGNVPPFGGPGIVIGEADERRGNIIYLPRPLEIKRLLEAAALLSEGSLQYSEYGYVVDSVRHTVSLGGRTARLTKRETELLCLLLSSCGEIVTKQHISEALWAGAAKDSNVCAVYVSYLRSKLEPLAGRGAIVSVNGGYMLCDPRGVSIERKNRND